MHKKKPNKFKLSEISRSSMKSQTAALTDVLDKSNNVLLQIEASRSLKPAVNDQNSTPYTYNKETVNDLTRVVDKFMNLLSVGEVPVESSNFEEYLETAGQRTVYLESNIRKLLAIWDTIQQMRCALERQEHEVVNEDESEVDSSF